MITEYRESVLEMGRSERRQLASRLYVLIQHLTKLEYVSDPVRAANARGWGRTVRDQRAELLKLLREHPSLKPELTQAAANVAYGAAIGELRSEYGGIAFPDACPFSIETAAGEELLQAFRG